MKKVATKLVRREVTEDIICDSCGKSCKSGEYGFDHMELVANWGFMSGKDPEQWEAHLCEECVDNKLGFIRFSKMNYLTHTKIED